MKKNLLVLSVVVCVALIGAVSLTVAKDNWIGSWKLDVGASKFSPVPAPTGQMLHFEAVKDGIRVHSESTDVEGKKSEMSYISMFDGKEVAWTGNPNADMATSMRIDANTYENTWKKGGKATIHAKVMVSEDGKTLTIKQNGMDAKGQAVDHVLVFHRM